jgi:hypothetical protein
MIRKVVLGLSVALATATGGVATAQAGERLDRVIGATKIGAQSLVRGAESFARGVKTGQVRQGAKDAIKDVKFGAEIGALILTGRGGGGFGNR